MKSTEYDGEGTANFVGMELVRTLGITQEKVSDIFHHSVYDGVYATAEERAHAGGCLSYTTPENFMRHCKLFLWYKNQEKLGEKFVYANQRTKKFDNSTFGSSIVIYDT